MDSGIGRGRQDEFKPPGVEQIRGAGPVLPHVEPDGLEAQRPFEAAREPRGLGHAEGMGTTLR